MDEVCKYPVNLTAQNKCVIVSSIIMSVDFLVVCSSLSRLCTILSHLNEETSFKC